MALQEFLIEGTSRSRVTKRGVRAQLYSLAPIYGLLVAPLNVTNNMVRVVVKGNKNEIESFYKAVSDYCKTELKLGSSRVKNLQKYKGVEPEWQAMATFYTAEQLTKGIDYLQSIDNQFKDSRDRFDKIGRGMTAVNEQFKVLPDLVREMKGLREDTTEEMRQLREVISKFTDVVEKLVKK